VCFRELQWFISIADTGADRLLESPTASANSPWPQSPWLAITALRQHSSQRRMLGWDCGASRWANSFRGSKDVHRLNAVVGSAFFTLMEMVPCKKLQSGCVSVPVAQPSVCFMKPDFLYCRRASPGQKLDAEFRPKSLNLAHCCTLIALHLGPERALVAASPLFSSGTGKDGMNMEHFIFAVVSHRWVLNTRKRCR